VTKSVLRSAFNGNSNHRERKGEINHGERRENTPELFGRAQREGIKQNTEILCEHGRIFLSLEITPPTAQIQPLTTTVCHPEWWLKAAVPKEGKW
jgi:hypothetical protein